MLTTLCSRPGSGLLIINWYCYADSVMTAIIKGIAKVSGFPFFFERNTEGEREGKRERKGERGRGRERRRGRGKGRGGGSLTL